MIFLKQEILETKLYLHETLISFLISQTSERDLWPI